MWGVGEERASNNPDSTSPVFQDDCIGRGLQAPTNAVFPAPYPLHPIRDRRKADKGGRRQKESDSCPLHSHWE